MKLRKLRPSAAMIVACVALIAAIGGSAYAASKINGDDIKRNTVTGKQVKEKSLNKVPKAKKADYAKRANRADTARNAKTVGGKKQRDLQTRWFLLNEDGVIEEQSGGFTVIDAYDTNTNTYVDTGESLEGKGLSATIAIQNQINGGSRNGEAAVIRCQIPGVVECAPDGAKNLSSLAVTASESDGNPAATASPGSGPGSSTKRIYVTVTE